MTGALATVGEMCRLDAAYRPPREWPGLHSAAARPPGSRSPLEATEPRRRPSGDSGLFLRRTATSSAPRPGRGTSRSDPPGRPGAAGHRRGWYVIGRGCDTSAAVLSVAEPSGAAPAAQSDATRPRFLAAAPPSLLLPPPPPVSRPHGQPHQLIGDAAKADLPGGRRGCS